MEPCRLKMETWRFNMEPCRLRMDPWRLTIEPWRVCRPGVVDSLTLHVGPDPYKSEKPEKNFKTVGFLPGHC